ncbi:hypothetical protein [Serinicoccus sp. LYQ131]|uniref:hypothetical protein n=1 Tax=Serinicoccus sp. LYQ131 TaxID=3378797 RepID=UPI0038525239
MKGVPWWGWVLIGIFVLNVLGDGASSFLPLVVIGMITVAIVGQRRRTGGRGQGPAPGSRVGPAAGGTGPLDGPQPPPPQGDVQPGPQPPPLPRIDVPAYPGAAAGAPPASTSRTGTGAVGPGDPVVSLAQLHLARLGRELDAAGRAGSGAEVGRLLEETGDLAARMVTMLSGAQGLPGSGRQEFESGLRRLQGEVAAARAEQAPGPRLARVVRTCTSMGQTGRHE